MAGGVATLLNGWWQAEELADGDRATSTARWSSPIAPRAKRLGGMRRMRAQVVAIDDTLPLAEALAPVLARATARRAAARARPATTIATILFTSGSTGQSKGALMRPPRGGAGGTSTISPRR